MLNHKERSLSTERLLTVLEYDHRTGVFTWRISLSNRAPVGAVAGRRTANGYWAINVDGQKYYAHRLAWFYVHGHWPSTGIDHRDRNKLHNWIDNLRPATKSENGANATCRGNMAGLKGVTSHQGRWRATIKKRYRRIDLGCYDTPEAAHAAYCAKAEELFGEFANDGR